MHSITYPTWLSHFVGSALAERLSHCRPGSRSSRYLERSYARLSGCMDCLHIPPMYSHPLLAYDSLSLHSCNTNVLTVQEV